MNTLVVRIAVFLIWALALSAMIAGCGDDPFPPSVPKNVNATAVSDTEIDVAWDAASATKGVEGYRVYRDGPLYTETGAIEFRDSGLTNSTEYCYEVQAYDEDDVRSDKSEPACATTLADAADAGAPAALTGLVANTVSSTEIGLTWTASTSGDVTKYKVYRDGAFVIDALDTAYANSGLTPNTLYCYIVNAVDASALESGPSNESCDTTLP
jgi:chitinase